MNPDQKRANLSVALALLVLLAQIGAFQFIYSRHLGDSGTIGNDYAYFLPALLNGYYWILNNGAGEVPWFTPALCGGLPFLPNPQNLFYSVPQLLTLLVDPLTAVALTFVLFAAAGFAGIHLLCRQSFGMSTAASLLGATLFMFNGFYAAHLLIGHLTLHSYMLIPLIAVLLLQPVRPRVRLQRAGCAVAAGALLGYILIAGGINFIVPVVLALVGIRALHRVMVGSPVAFWGPCLVALTTAGALSAFRLHGAVAFVQNFPRDYYHLPGFADFGTALWFTLRALFFQPSLEATGLVGAEFHMENHEGYFSITPAGAFVLAVALAAHVVDRFARRGSKPRALPRPELFLVAAILLLPVALNTHEPGWTEFLGAVPYINSHSHLLRWIAIDIPIVVLIVAAVLNALPFRRLRTGLTLFGIAAVPLFACNADFSLMERQRYHPGELTAAYVQARRSGQTPEIRIIEAQTDRYGRLAGTADANQRFIRGASAYPCYEPIFGYRLERFPLGALRPGPVFRITDNLLNLKDPVCYVYGKANGCRPGDQFAANDLERARALAGYRPVSFTRPAGLNIALFVSALTAMIALVALAWLFAKRTRRPPAAPVISGSANADNTGP